MEEENSNNGCCFPPLDSAPWLVYSHGKWLVYSHDNDRRGKWLVYTDGNDSSKNFVKSRFSSNDRWSVLHDLTMFTLWNLRSLQSIDLPPLNLLGDEVDISCAMVYPDGDDVTVFIFVNGLAFSCRPYRDNNNNTWIAHNTHFLGEMAKVVDFVICNGVIYGCVYVSPEGGVGNYHHLIIEVNNNNNGNDFSGMLTLRSLGVEVPKPSFSYSCFQQHLLASCGQVYVVRIYSRFMADKRICGVNIWELDLSFTKWVQVKCLGDRSFLVGERINTWCWGSTDDHNELGGVKRNSVYFEVPRSDLNGVPKAMYSYNLQDESLTIFLPYPNIPSFFVDPIWIIPQNHRLVICDKYKHSTGKICFLKQGLQEQNEGHTLLGKSESSQSSDAPSLTFDKQKQNDEFLLCELSMDLITLVSAHMHLFDYMNFRATCREFRCMAPVARLRENSNSYPLLMFFEREEPRCMLMDPCRGDSRYIVIPELFRGAICIDSSKDGWLLLRTNADVSLYFFNPITGVRGEYPPCSSMHQISSVGFSICPISSDCVTVGINWFANDNVYLCYHRFNEETWHECNLSYVFNVEFRPVLSPIYHKGVFYFWDIRGYLGVFQLDNEQGTCSWDVYGEPQTLNTDTDTDTFPYSSYLVECGGELLSVFVGDMGKLVRVFRFAQQKKKWTRVRSLGNYLLFVGTSSSFSAVAKESGMANRIYFPRMRDNGILYYDLDTGKYTTHIHDESFEDFSGSKEHIRCSWI